MREYEVKQESSLYALHLYLLNDLSFAPDQIVLFRVLDEDKKISKEYGLFDLGAGTMDSVKLQNLYNGDALFLEYLYDPFRKRSIHLELIGVEEENRRESYPRLVAEKGKNPDQFSDNWDDLEQLIDFSEDDLLANPIDE